MNIQQASLKYREKIKELQDMVEGLERIQELLPKEEVKSLETLVCKRYLELGVIMLVVKEVNQAGFRKDGKVYSSNDITQLIRSKRLEHVNPQLHRAAKVLLHLNKGKVVKV